jgi:hypothetical protein
MLLGMEEQHRLAPKEQQILVTLAEDVGLLAAADMFRISRQSYAVLAAGIRAQRSIVAAVAARLMELGQTGRGVQRGRQAAGRSRRFRGGQ